MPQNLFAACGRKGQLTAKRIPLDRTVQQAVTEMFDRQEASFREGVTDEIPFDGSWKPDEYEFLTIDVPEDATVFENTIVANAISIPEIDTTAFGQEEIKALFTGLSVSGGAIKVLVQRFTPQQLLERRFVLQALLQDGNTFRRLSDPAFTLDTALTCIIENGLVKFKSQQKLRSIIDLSEIYREATDHEVRYQFAGHNNVRVEDIDAFMTAVDQPSRKLIRAILAEGLLDRCPPATIKTEAEQTCLEVEVQNGKVVVPTERKELKDLLVFLNEGRYSGPLSQTPYITNSRRPA